MKQKTIYPILVLYIFFVVNAFAQIAQTEDDVKKLMFTSNLEKIAEAQGSKGQDLGVKAIENILIHHEYDLLGDISEISKFATLQELCSKIGALPERQQLGEKLFELFKKLSVLEGEPENWNEVLVKGEGGALGLITRSLIESADADLKSKVVDYLVEVDQPSKTKVFLEKAKFLGQQKELTELLAEKMEKVKSDEIKKLFKNFVEETSSEQKYSSDSEISIIQPSEESLPFLEETQAQTSKPSEREAKPLPAILSSEFKKTSSFPWWLLGFVVLVVVMGFILLKGKSK